MGDFIRDLTHSRMISVVLEKAWHFEKWYNAKLFCTLHYLKNANSGRCLVILAVLTVVSVFFVVRGVKKQTPRIFRSN